VPDSRLVLSIAVTRFDDADVNDLDEKVLARQKDLIDVLISEPFNYDPVPVAPAVTKTSRELGGTVEALLERNDLGSSDMVIIHILSHGVTSHGEVHVIGSDCATPQRSSVAGWIQTLYKRAVAGPAVLLILDFCSSGLVVPEELSARHQGAGRQHPRLRLSGLCRLRLRTVSRTTATLRDRSPTRSVWPPRLE